MHVICEWLGNSDTVAVKHYLKVTGGHMAAGSLVETVDKSVSKSVSKFSLTPCHAVSGDSQTLENTSSNVIVHQDASGEILEVGDEGLEPPTSSV